MSPALLLTALLAETLSHTGRQWRRLYRRLAQKWLSQRHWQSRASEHQTDMSHVPCLTLSDVVLPHISITLLYSITIILVILKQDSTQSYRLPRSRSCMYNDTAKKKIVQFSQDYFSQRNIFYYHLQWVKFGVVALLGAPCPSVKLLMGCRAEQASMTTNDIKSDPA